MLLPLLALPLGYTLLVVLNWCRGGEAKSTVVLRSLLVGGFSRPEEPLSLSSTHLFLLLLFQCL